MFGFSLVMRGESTFSSADAAARLTLGFNRAITDSVLPWRFVSGVRGKGVNTSIREPGAKIDPKSNDGGSTPTTIVDAPLSMIGFPTIPGSEAKRRSHRAWLISAAFGPFQALSSALNPRPIIGRTPRKGKNFCVTRTG